MIINMPLASSSDKTSMEFIPANTPAGVEQLMDSNRTVVQNENSDGETHRLFFSMTSSYDKLPSFPSFDLPFPRQQCQTNKVSQQLHSASAEQQYGDNINTAPDPNHTKATHPWTQVRPDHHHHSLATTSSEQLSASPFLYASPLVGLHTATAYTDAVCDAAYVPSDAQSNVELTSTQLLHGSSGKTYEDSGSFLFPKPAAPAVTIHNHSFTDSVFPPLPPRRSTVLVDNWNSSASTTTSNCDQTESSALPPNGLQASEIPPATPVLHSSKKSSLPLSLQTSVIDELSFYSSPQLGGDLQDGWLFSSKKPCPQNETATNYPFVPEDYNSCPKNASSIPWQAQLSASAIGGTSERLAIDTYGIRSTALGDTVLHHDTDLTNGVTHGYDDYVRTPNTIMPQPVLPPPELADIERPRSLGRPFAPITASPPGHHRRHTAFASVHQDLSEDAKLFSRLGSTVLRSTPKGFPVFSHDSATVGASNHAAEQRQTVSSFWSDTGLSPDRPLLVTENLRNGKPLPIGSLSNTVSAQYKPRRSSTANDHQFDQQANSQQYINQHLQVPLSVFVGNIPKNVNPESFYRLMQLKGKVTEISCDFRSNCWLTAFVTYSKASEAAKAVECLNNRRAFKSASPHRLVCCYAPFPPASLCLSPPAYAISLAMAEQNASDGSSSQIIADASTQQEGTRMILPFFPKFSSESDVLPGSRRAPAVRRFSLLRDGPPGANLFIYGIPSDWTEVTLMRLCQEFGHIVGIRVPGAPTTGTQRLNKGFGFVSYDSTESSSRALKELTGRQFLGKPLIIQLKLGEQLSGYMSPLRSPTVNNGRHSSDSARTVTDTTDCGLGLTADKMVFGCGDGGRRTTVAAVPEDSRCMTPFSSGCSISLPSPFQKETCSEDERRTSPAATVEDGDIGSNQCSSRSLVSGGRDVEQSLRAQHDTVTRVMVSSELSLSKKADTQGIFDTIGRNHLVLQQHGTLFPTTGIGSSPTSTTSTTASATSLASTPGGARHDMSAALLPFGWNNALRFPGLPAATTATKGLRRSSITSSEKPLPAISSSSHLVTPGGDDDDDDDDDSQRRFTADQIPPLAHMMMSGTAAGPQSPAEEDLRSHKHRHAATSPQEMFGRTPPLPASDWGVGHQLRPEHLPATAATGLSSNCFYDSLLSALSQHSTGNDSWRFAGACAAVDDSNRPMVDTARLGTARTGIVNPTTETNQKTLSPTGSQMPSASEAFYAVQQALLPALKAPLSSNVRPEAATLTDTPTGFQHMGDGGSPSEMTTHSGGLAHDHKSGINLAAAAEFRAIESASRVFHHDDGWGSQMTTSHQLSSAETDETEIGSLLPLYPYLSLLLSQLLAERLPHYCI